MWGKVFKNGPSKICGRQPLNFFTWTIIEYLVAFRMKFFAKIFLTATVK